MTVTGSTFIAVQTVRAAAVAGCPGRTRFISGVPTRVLATWPSSSQYVIGTFFSLSLLFDGLGLIATGYGGRRIVGMVSDRLAAEKAGETERAPDGGTVKPVQPD